MTAATLSPGTAHVAALPMAPSEHADTMARLTEKAKEEVLVTLLGALRSVAVAVTISAQRLQALQEEAAAAARAQGSGRAGGAVQAQEFALDDDEDSPVADSALEAEYDLLDSAATASNSHTTRHPSPAREPDLSRVLELLGAVGDLAAPPADHAPLLAQAAAIAAVPAAAASADAASPAAAAAYTGPIFEPPDLPASRCRLDDEVACGRCGISGDAASGPPRTASGIRIGSGEYSWLCYTCTAACHREIGYSDEARMQELMAEATARPRCPAETSGAGTAAHARCGPSWLVPAAQSMPAEETEAHEAAYLGRLPCAAKVEAEAAGAAGAPEGGGGVEAATAPPAAPPAEGAEEAYSDEEWRVWLQAVGIAAEAPAAPSEPPDAWPQPAAWAAWREEAEVEAPAGGAEEVSPEATKGDFMMSKEREEDSTMDTQLSPEACSFFRQLSVDSSAGMEEEDEEEEDEEEEDEEMEEEEEEEEALLAAASTEPATPEAEEEDEDEEEAAAKVKADVAASSEEASTADSEKAVAEASQVSYAPAPVDAEYYVICFAKNWKREQPMRPVESKAAGEYANYGGTWLAHRLEMAATARSTKFQILCGDISSCKAIWTGAVRDAAEAEARDSVSSRNSWPPLELQGPALTAALRTREQQPLKGLDWIVKRPPGGGSVAVLYNPEKQLILCRPAEEVEELCEEVAGAQEEREKGLYLVRGSEGWEIADGQGPMVKEVDANGVHQLVQVITLPPGSSTEQLRILRDGQADLRFAPLVTDMPESNAIYPDGPECLGDWLMPERRWPPPQDWLVRAEAGGATVQIVWRSETKTLLCKPWEEPKQVRAARWTTLAARGGGAATAAAASPGELPVAAACAVLGGADHHGGAEEGIEVHVQPPEELEAGDEEAASLTEEQAAAAADELEWMYDAEINWATVGATPGTEVTPELGTKELTPEDQESVEAELRQLGGAGGQEEALQGGNAEASPSEPHEEAAAGDSADWAKEASVEELVQRMDLHGPASTGSPVTLEDEINAYTAAMALARRCEGDVEARARALATGAAKAVARLFGNGSKPSADAGDPEDKLTVSTARSTALFAWETLPAQALPAGAQADAAAREASRATTGELQPHFEELERECLGVRCAQHAAQEPRRRRGSSWPRTLSFAKVKLGAHPLGVRAGTAEDPFRIWVLGATNEVEVALAEEGYFEDANHADSAPTEVVLVGERLRSLELAPGREKGAVVRTMTYEELRWQLCLGLRLPDLVAALMPGAVGQGLPPDRLLEAVEEVPAVVSMRFQLDESCLLALKQKMARGRLLWKPTPCPFSSCPEGSAVAFADNGWILAVRGPGTLKRAWTLGAPQAAPPCEPRPKAQGESIPACFWGILDIKYDTSRPVLERVKVLETGDGKTSKFSGDGADLRRRYVEKYKPSEDSSIAMYEVISADKLLTHNLTADNGYEHVLPKQAVFERRYKSDLAEHIAAELGLMSDEDLVVLKLCNRTRGAGVVVSSRSELDDKLWRLLHPPRDLEAWIQSHSNSAFKFNGLDLGIDHAASFQEQERHWWSNECPVFVAERCEQSLLTQRNGEHFDGTLRAGFVLRRRGAEMPKVSRQEKARKALIKARQPGEALPEIYGEDEDQTSTGNQAEDFEIDWLGCYWKLPKKPRKSVAESSREAIVSAARTSGTAPVHPAHCHEVYAALGDLVPRLFCTPEFQPEALLERYRPYPGLPSYLTATLSASMKRMKGRRSRLRAEELLKQARTMLEQESDSRGVQLAFSYVHREFCSCLARHQSAENWGAAVTKHNRDSLQYMPTNANSLYIEGMRMLQSMHEKEAEKPLLQSLLLDPDFKLAYVQLGICYLRQGLWDKAIAVCEAGLERNPSQPQFKYHMGLAFYQKALEVFDSNMREDLHHKALENLRLARQSPEARKVAKGYNPFSEKDDKMLRSLERSGLHNLEVIRLSPKVGWVCASNRI